MLMGYRSTPHPATGIAPMVQKHLTYTRLSNWCKDQNNREAKITQNDWEYKNTWNEISGQRGNQEHVHTISKQEVQYYYGNRRKNKWSTAYEIKPYIEERINGSSIAARCKTHGNEIYRNATFYKLARNSSTNRPPLDWREHLRKNWTDKHASEK